MPEKATYEELEKKIRELEQKESERKRVDEAIKKSEEILQMFIKHTPAAIAMCDLEMRYMAYSDRWVRDYGLSNDNLIGKYHYDVFPDLPSRWKEEHKRCFLGDVIKNEEEPFPRDDGSMDWVRRNLYPWSHKSGEVGGLIMFTEVITDHKQAEETLRESEEKYRNILTNIDDGYFEVDNTGNFTFSNDSMCKILGYPKNGLVGMNNREYMDEENAKKIFRTFSRVYRTGISTKALDWKLLRKDGTECFVETVVSLIKDSNGNGIGFRGIARDITERKRLESQLQQAMRMESIGTLAGGIAHDFNNLLMGIQGRVSLISLDLEPSHSHLRHTNAIEDYIRSATDLTKQLLGLAHGGKYEVKPTDTNELVNNTVNMFGRTKKEIRIHTNFIDPPPVVMVDRSQIKQVLLNLYINAWQAMPGGGELYLETRIVTLDDAYCKPYQAKPGQYAKVSVTDTGIGMDAETSQRIFDPFFTTKKKSRGTGLGLASAYGIIKNHGGIIIVKSEIGQGTTFNIYLPLSDKEAYRATPITDRSIRGSETVLLIDDEELILEVGKAMLEELGYNVIVAPDGGQAIELVQQKGAEIELVILDLIMPGLEGGKVFDSIREIQPALPVILSSGYSLEGQANDIMQRGCNGFIQKPFNLSELSQKIRKVLDGENRSDLHKGF
jgi:two-component system cell cycle sensor histidine kinase/response regulator CckA